MCQRRGTTQVTQPIGLEMNPGTPCRNDQGYGTGREDGPARGEVRREDQQRRLEAKNQQEKRDESEGEPWHGIKC